MRDEVMRWGLFVSFFSFASFVFMPFTGPYMQGVLAKSGSALPVEVWLGILASVAPLAIILFSHYLGSLSDSLGRRRVILIGMGSSVLSAIAYLLASGPLLLVLAKAFESLGYLTVITISLAKVNDIVKDDERGWKQSVFLSMQQVGNMLGPLVGGFLSARFAPNAPFLGALILYGFLMIVWLRDLPPKAKGTASLSLLRNWRKFLGFRKLKGMAVLGMSVHAHASIIFVFLPIYVIERFGEYRYLGIAMFCLALFKPLQFIVGRYVDRYGKAKLTVLGCIGLALSLFFIPVTLNIYEFFAILLLYSLFSAIWNVGAWTVMSSIGEANHIEGHIVGSYASMAKVGDFVASLAFGVIAAHFGIAMLFPIAAFVLLAGVLVSLVFLKDAASTA